MADIYTTGLEEAAAPGERGLIARATSYAGAAMSLGLVVGIGIWGTQIILRDVSDIPVVKAAEGPMRIAPDRPGGEPADHQGLSVNAVAGTGTAAKPADTLRLAPGADPLTDEDVAFAEIAPRSAEAAATPAAQAPLPSLAELTESAESPEAALQALADQLAAGAAPLSDLEPEADRTARAVDAAVAEAMGETPDMTVKAASIIPASVPGVAVSLRPTVRPASLSTSRPVATPAVQEKPETPEIAAAEIADGTRLVQLGAYDSAETARSEWDRLEARFEEYMDGHARVIQRASSGGKTFYRLRAHGFESLSDARRFCAAFVAGNADCIPVVAR
ncbi:SPOR domain-containing protein [Roseivivax sediminis]|uniref:Cell division protein FtsN n=1 Tax=Roseivivax sediminis TaxID=936889 RepID=A0A1I1WTX2_9RHOB|nr:SPOR domain-containing protein [Roseivivax sediminis]SFD98451.1 Cell division protein FtsN [Roseivivax sediminis]